MRSLDHRVNATPSERDLSGTMFGRHLNGRAFFRVVIETAPP
jgi:hypothetical protein